MCDFCVQNNPADNPVVTRYYNVCHACIETLIENEAERRGVEADAQAFAQYHGGSGSDKERQDMIEAGRIR